MAISSLLFLAACGGDNSSGAHRSGVVEINGKFISGVSQKGPFVTGSTVKLYELDGKTYAQTGKSFTGKIISDDGKFSISSVTLASQYALLEANGFFRDEITGLKSKAPLTLYAFTDLSDREKVNINLLTHLEYERALYLVGTGLDLPSAKKQAEVEILNAFGIKGEFANSEDLDIFSRGEDNAALLAFNVLMLGGLLGVKDETDVAELTERLTKFALDIEKDGIWDDEETKAKIADWVAETNDRSEWGGFASVRDNIEKWELGMVPEFEKYVRNFWYMNYGLGECGLNNKDEIKTSNNEHSTNYGKQTLYICKNDVWSKAQEVDFRIREKELDTYGESCTGKEIGKTIDGAVTATNKYYCTANGWESLMNDWSWNVPKEVRFNSEIAYDFMEDSRDGQVYKTVKIGDQVWMAENLNYADSSTNLSLKGNSWCYDNKEEYCAVAGRLYTWVAATGTDDGYKLDCVYAETCVDPPKTQGICPPGWHLPTGFEWNTLISEVGGNSIAGNKLKSQTGWDRYNNGLDAYGFSALPAGGKSYNDGFNRGFFAAWSASYGGDGAVYALTLIFDHVDAYPPEDYSMYKTMNDAYSVRCLQD